MDQLMLIILLAGLVMLSRSRKSIIAKNPKGYNQISAGISLISFWGVISVMQNTFLGGKIIAAETEAMTEILMLMVALSGLILLSSGISYWLPVAKKHTPGMKSAQDNDTDVLALTKLLLSNITTEKLSTELSNWLLNRYELDQVDVISISNKTLKSSLMASAGSLDKLHLLPAANIDKSAWPKRLQSRQVTRVDELNSTYSYLGEGFGFVLKLNVTQNRSLLFVMWSQNSKLAETIAPEIIDVLESGIAANLDHQTMILTDDFIRDCDRKAKQMLNKVSNLTNTNEIFSLTCSHFAELMPLELMTLVSFNNCTENCRLTVGATGTVLFETGVDIFESEETYLTRISKTSIPIMESDLTTKPQKYGTRMMAASDIKSMIVIPVYAQGRMQGIVTVGSAGKEAYTRRNLQLLLSAAPVFDFILSMIYGDQIAQLVLKREKAISGFALDITSYQRKAADPFGDAAKLLYEYTNCDTVRISLIDQDDSFLTSKVLLNCNSQETVVPEKGHMILSLMPNHRSVIETGESLNLSDCDSSNRLNEAELSQCFAPNAKSALLIPIMTNSQAAGIIGLASFQSEAAARFDELTMQFGEIIASLLARHMEQSISVSSDLIFGKRENVTNTGGLRQGRVLSGETFKTEETDRLLLSIDKPAGKMDSVLTD